jgi:hypothetical protein
MIAACPDPEHALTRSLPNFRFTFISGQERTKKKLKVLIEPD